MINTDFYSKATDTFKDAVGFAVALFISLLFVGFTAFYSFTFAFSAVVICTSIVLAVELFLTLFVDPKQESSVYTDNPYKESWRDEEIFDNHDITIEGTSNEKAQ